MSVTDQNVTASYVKFNELQMFHIWTWEGILILILDKARTWSLSIHMSKFTDFQLTFKHLSCNSLGALLVSQVGPLDDTKAARTKDNVADVILGTTSWLVNTNFIIHRTIFFNLRDYNTNAHIWNMMIERLSYHVIHSITCLFNSFMNEFLSIKRYCFNIR